VASEANVGETLAAFRHHRCVRSGGKTARSGRWDGACHRTRNPDWYPRSIPRRIPRPGGTGGFVHGKHLGRAPAAIAKPGANAAVRTRRPSRRPAPEPICFQRKRSRRTHPDRHRGAAALGAAAPTSPPLKAAVSAEHPANVHGRRSTSAPHCSSLLPHWYLWTQTNRQAGRPKTTKPVSVQSVRPSREQGHRIAACMSAVSKSTR